MFGKALNRVFLKSSMSISSAVSGLAATTWTVSEAILSFLVTGCSWDVARRLGMGSETTLRRRRDEWWRAGMFDGLFDETLAGDDRLTGFDLSETSIDGSPNA